MIHTLICRTEGCGNQDYEVEFPNPSELVICGACNTQITDITPPIPAGGYLEESTE